MFRSYRDTIRTPVQASKEAARTYYCDLCDEGDIRQAWFLELDVEIHRRRAHKVELIQLMREPKNYMCSICLRTQADRSTLIAHIKKHHLLSPPNSICVKREIFICDYCNNVFFNKLLLIAHIKYFHLLTSVEKKTAKTVCPACLKSVNVRSIWFHFLYHGIIHTGTCPICLTTFENYNIALQHIESHPGYYSCKICPYEAKKENLFQNHIDKHKKMVNLEGREDVNAVARFFVPQRRPASWNRKFMNIFKGITLAPDLQICVLCRTMCDTEEQMLQHIYGDHLPDNVTEMKRHLCSCGEEFFNSVLLKHHIFTMKGTHKVHDGTSPLVTPATKSTETLLQEDNRTFGIEIVIQESVSDHEDPPQDPKEPKEPQETVTQMNCEPVNSTSQEVTDINSNTPVENVPMKCGNDDQTNAVTQINSEPINQIDEDMNRSRINKSEPMDESDITDIQPDKIKNVPPKKQIILNSTCNNYNNQMSAIERIMFDKKNENKTIYHICDEMGSESATVSAMFGSPKQYYEQVLTLDGNVQALCGSTGSSANVEFVNNENEAIVYEVLEVPADSNEDADRIIVEESIVYNL